MNPRLAFIARGCHRHKTRSDQFLIDLLKQRYEVTIFDRDALKGRALTDAIRTHQPDHVLYYQLSPSPTKHLIPLWRYPSTWVPMWDGFKPPSLFKRSFFKAHGLKIISFCEALHRTVMKEGLPSLRVQFFPEISTFKQSPSQKGPFTLFFWERSDDISLEEIELLIPPSLIKKVIYKCEIDKSLPQTPFPVEKLPGWGSLDTYHQAVGEADFYLAPRFSEGIGMSFLEAMARGVIPIGYDAPTMNEYIQHLENGLLFKGPGCLTNLPSPYGLSDGLRASCDRYQARWQEDQTRLLDFISK